ncbi:ASGR2 protein, partial [Alectura lathami]|nr:ASGR2 protein [Alectura lathami]
IYSVAGSMTPMGDFRPASPDSFADEDDYDDVSVSEPDRSPKPPASNEDLQSQRSKGGRVYILAGKPTPRHPSQTGDPEPGKGCGGGRTSVAVLYVLVALSFVAWVLLLALALAKQVEIMAELKLLRSNLSESQAVLQELQDSRREQARMRSGMHSYYQDLQDIAALLCKVLPDRKCLPGWTAFGRSCYSFSSERLSWADARETCSDRGAHLVIVDSDREQ